MKLFIIFSLSITLCSCAYHPKQIEVYDSKCNITYKKLTVQKPNIGISCNNESCIAALLSIPVQAIVVGSIVIAGNAISWLQKEGLCLLNDKS